MEADKVCPVKPRFPVALILAFLLPGSLMAFAKPPARPIAPTPTPSPFIVVASPTPGPTAPPASSPSVVVPEAEKPFVAPPTAFPELSKAGHDLVVEFEVGGRSGYSPRPEAPDARFSGITWGIGYDAHQNKKEVILDDWKALDAISVRRLAETQPYYGRSAQAHLKDVKDILVAWTFAIGVFDRIDVTREFDNAKRAMDGFEELRPNAQAAIISLGFNRGWSMTGSSRTEMREIRALVPKKDYAGIAKQFRLMVRVWKGTEIERGMTRRRLAEAKLVETP